MAWPAVSFVTKLDSDGFPGSPPAGGSSFEAVGLGSLVDALRDAVRRCAKTGVRREMRDCAETDARSVFAAAVRREAIVL